MGRKMISFFLFSDSFLKTNPMMESKSWNSKFSDSMELKFESYHWKDFNENQACCLVRRFVCAHNENILYSIDNCWGWISIILKYGVWGLAHITYGVYGKRVSNSLWILKVHKGKMINSFIHKKGRWTRNSFAVLFFTFCISRICFSLFMIHKCSWIFAFLF